MASSAENMQVLADAVARNAAIVLSLPSAGLVRHHKTRFLGETEAGFWIETVPEAAILLKELQKRSLPLAVSFNCGTRRLSFASTVVKIENAFAINAETSVSAVMVARPTELKGVQRRAAYRVKVPQDCELRVRLWVIPEHAYLPDQPSATAELKFALQDLSAGGLGVRLAPSPDKPLSLVADQRLRVELKYTDVELILDARLRGEVKPTAIPKSSGIVFKKLDADLEGRQKLASLTRIVGELQRDEVRRMRMGMTG